MNDLLFKIGPLIPSTSGSQDVNQIEIDNPYLNLDYQINSKIKGEIVLMKLDEGINVTFYDISFSIKVPCINCLKDFKKEIIINESEKQFYFSRPDFPTEEEDQVTLVDLKKSQLDLTDFLRQEIILHFPSNPVCSKSCKGLCPSCGKNLNQEKCNCFSQSQPSSPFDQLKDMFK